MAGRFPIYRTKKTLPGQGPNVTGRVTFDTGAGQMAAALGRMGEAMFQVGGQMWEVQASKDFAAATREAEREVNRLSAFVRDNHDLDAIDERKQQAYEYLHGMEIKNGLAARKYQLWLDNALPTIERGVEAQVRQITIDDWHGGLAQAEAQAINAGNMAAVEALVQTGQAERILTAEKAKQHLTTTEYELYLKRVYDNPELMESVVKSTIPQGSKYLDAGHGVALRSNLQNALREKKQKQETVSAALIEDVNKLAVQSAPASEVQTLIRQTVGISETQKTELMKVYLDAMRQWDISKINPYEETRNPAAVLALDIAIDGGVPLTEMDIWKAQNSDPKRGPIFNRSDALSLIGRLDAKNKEITSNPIMKTWEAKIDDIFDINTDDPKKNSVEQLTNAWSAKKQVREIVTRFNGDMTQAAPFVQALLDEYDTGFLENWMHAVPFWGKRWQKTDDLNRLKRARDLQIKLNKATGSELAGMSDEELKKIAEGGE